MNVNTNLLQFPDRFIGFILGISPNPGGVGPLNDHKDVIWGGGNDGLQAQVLQQGAAAVCPFSAFRDSLWNGQQSTLSLRLQHFSFLGLVL